MKRILSISSIAAILLALTAACTPTDWKEGYVVPPPIPGSEDPEPEPENEEDGDFESFPSLLTDSEATRKAELDGQYSPSMKLLSGGTYLSTLEYVVLLYKEGSAASLERGEGILKTICAAQVTDKTSTHYGNWAWGVNDKVSDRNPPLFFARRMLGELWPMMDRMRPSMVKVFKNSCTLLADAAKRRWDVEKFAANRSGVRYTNAFTLYIETLTLAGVRFEDKTYTDLAKQKWDEYYDHFTKYGLDEFLSTGYDDITFNALYGIRCFASSDEQKTQITEVMDHMYITKTAIIHPKLYTPVCGISRDERKFNAGNDARSEFVKPNKAPADYVIPQEAVTLKNSRTYPFEINGRAGDYTFTYKAYFDNEKSAMGSMTGWGCYYAQNVHLMACAGTSTSARSTMFIPGSFVYANGFVDQKKLTALCVYNRLPTLWHVGQWGGNLSDISSTFFDFGIGLSTQWVDVSNESGKIVLNANKRGYDLYLYPFVLSGDSIEPCSLNKVSRTKTSEKYHVTDLKFDELLFPSSALWFGVYVKLVPSDETVPDPTISYKKNGDMFVFSTNEGHELKIKSQEGAYVQVRDVDPLTQPLYSY